jgi:hypothetical protein
MKECDDSIFGKRNLDKIEAFKPQAYYIIQSLKAILDDDYTVLIDDLKSRVDAITTVDEVTIATFYKKLAILCDNHRLISFTVSLARSNFTTVLTLPVDDFSSNLTPLEWNLLSDSKEAVRRHTSEELKRISTKVYQSTTSPKQKKEDREKLMELRQKHTHPLLLISKAGIDKADAKVLADHKVRLINSRSKRETKILSNSFLSFIRLHYLKI